MKACVSQTDRPPRDDKVVPDAVANQAATSDGWIDRFDLWNPSLNELIIFYIRIFRTIGLMCGFHLIRSYII